MRTFKIMLAICFIAQQIPTFAQGVTWQYFSMYGNECKIFTTSGNSRIIVPDYCFTLAGKPYNGPVTIAFKEYKDQIDFILGGLSLRYEINGSLKTLQSGGMFEIDIKTNTEPPQSLKFAPNKKATVKFAIDPKFDVAGLEPFFFDPATKRWVKTTRFGKSRESNQPVSDKNSDLWQDDPQIVKFADRPTSDEPDGDVECYTISVVDPKNPLLFIDTVICPGNYNSLDNKYSNYLSNQAYKTMQIDQMGLFNYDKIMNDENNVPMFVNLVTKDGKAFELSDRLYVIYKLTNSVIYYYKSDLAGFSLLARPDITIFSYNTDGTISRVPESFWKNFDARLNRGKTINLPFETLKLSTLSKEQFAAVTGLKN